jgi:4-alpha-glucanotransferase
MQHPPDIPERLGELADACGVATSYLGSDGGTVEVPAATVRSVLGALGIDAADEEAAGASLRALEAVRGQRPLGQVHVVREGRPATLEVPAGAVGRARIELEDGTAREVDLTDGLLPDVLPLGYHRLVVPDGGRGAVTTLIVAPGTCPAPTRRQWGWMAQLYQLRSRSSWGMGDAHDLRLLAERSATELGAGFVVCNPIHAVTPTPPLQPSPYFPSSRRFANPLYLRVDEVPERSSLTGAERDRLEALEERARALNEAATIDYDAVWDLKRRALELLHTAARSEARERAYRAFVARQGRGLVDFATFCALAERHGPTWQHWPAELRDPTSAAVAAAREELSDRVEVHLWLQWLADAQLGAAHDAATAAGMAVGIVHDLAVGVDPGGADAWALQAELATGVRVGAPPDGFNQQGQDWGLPPLRPDRLLATGLRPLRDMLRSVLAHAGGIRIDHALGLFRLFWIPEGVGAEEGTYVRYPAEAMLAVLALEAERAGAVVIGEDLGTVEEGVHERLRDAGVLGSRVLYFEWEHGRRKPAAHYEREALASVTTHDLPTALGWWRGEGVRLRVDLDLLGPGNDERSERARLDAERAAMLDLLADEGLLTADPGEREIVEAMHAFLARTPSLLVAASPADAIGDPRQPNLPGTVDEYPNWRLPLAIDDGDGPAVVDLDDLLDHPRTRALARALRR